ncbi:MAG: hypothetical protein ABSD03_16240 [Vulcanimicrobiaceae bacterium]|jgi:hypothetical protein
MRNGIVAGTLPAGLHYSAQIQAAADQRNFSAELLYAIGWVEIIATEISGWIAEVYPGMTAATLISTKSPPPGYGAFQETPETSGNELPANWQDVTVAALFAIDHHLAEAWTFWATQGLEGDDLVRAIAAEFNAGRGGAERGHAAGDIGLDTTHEVVNGVSTSYSDRVLAAYTSLVAGKEPALS